MIVCGIDPSLSGTAVCTSVLGSYDLQVCSSPTTGKGVRQRIPRFVSLALSSLEILKDIPVGLILIEGYSHGSIGRHLDLAEYGGILRQMLMSVTDNIYEAAPSTVKKFALGGRKVKKGIDPKALILKAILLRWGEDFYDDDAGDAYAIWRLAQMVADPSLCQTEVDRECVRAITTPPSPPKKRKRDA